MFWLGSYHADGLRVDAVASMLYLDYGAQGTASGFRTSTADERISKPSHFLRQLNEAVFRDDPRPQTIAEESTAWPMVTRPTYLGGLGFGMKWNMGWMHDTLDTCQARAGASQVPPQRSSRSACGMHSARTSCCRSRTMRSCTAKDRCSDSMPGDDWQRFANLRRCSATCRRTPARSSLFMGGEFGQWSEWNHDSESRLASARAAAARSRAQMGGRSESPYRASRRSSSTTSTAAGFEWIDASDAEHSILASLRCSTRRRT